jgi:phosphoribosylaminoimidazole-succinocarboxamide synthase
MPDARLIAFLAARSICHRPKSPSFDKQFVRDYLETLDWDKTPPAPKLPGDVIARTAAKYIEAFERLTGKKLKATVID